MAKYMATYGNCGVFCFVLFFLYPQVNPGQLWPGKEYLKYVITSEILYLIICNKKVYKCGFSVFMPGSVLQIKNT